MALDVTLRGTRNYVQGSQILGRTAAWLASRPDGHHLTLTTAKFTRITDRLVAARLLDVGAEPGAPEPDQIGEARFAAEPQEPARIVQFLEGTTTAPRIADEPSRLLRFEETARLSGSADYRITNAMQSYLAATIEFVKWLHARAAADVTDIWFTSLASARLAVAPDYAATATMTVTLEFERPHAGRLLTLCRVESSDRALSPFNIGFSCKVAEGASRS
ncbi:MAG: hypothetical protein GC150_08980 [Rhizobiales bacterium]|nr:hypothetical protein [Hyphomicrobiales bacterium]